MPNHNARPRSLILDVYGGFVRRLGGWISISDLIRLLADVGVDEPAVRSSVSLMKRRGLLEFSRQRGTAGYRLSHQAAAVLKEGDSRIFRGRAPADLGEGWVLVVFHVPESDRDRRHVLRTQLSWLGLGRVAPGTWIGPHRLFEDVRVLLDSREIIQYVDLFEARYEGFQNTRHMVSRAWDLPGLRSMYRAFIRSQSPALARWRRSESPDPQQAFIDYILCVDQWRRFPYLDPGLPLKTLPAGWEGDRARQIFAELISAVDAPALAYVRSVLQPRKPRKAGTRSRPR